MDFSTLGRRHQPIHQVPRRSSVSSEPSSNLWFSGFFSSVPAGARLCCLGMLALILTLPWNPPSAYAWSFSNDSIPAPPIVMDLDAPSASPPALPSDGPLVAPPKVPPLPSRVLISSPLTSESPPPFSMANPPSPSIQAPGPTPIAKKRKRLNWGAIVGIVVSAFVVGICLPGLLWWYIVFQRSFTSQHIFISSASPSYGSRANFPMWLNENIAQSLLKSHVKIFFDQEYTIFHEIYAKKIFEELKRFDIGIVVVTEEYFVSKWSMTELIAFVEAQSINPRNRIHILPLFYGLTPEALKDHLLHQTWEGSWEEMSKGTHPITVEKCREAVARLCTIRGIVYNSHICDDDNLYDNYYEYLYLNTICQKLDEILPKERNIASNLRLAKNIVVERITTMTCIDTKKRRRANPRAGKENGLMTYINKRLQLLFALSGLLNILLSIILDNFFNDLPVRFTAFGILAPLTIFLGFLASGWFPRIPLRFIAFVKRRGFLQQVVPCSPWHDNVVINFCGEVCTLEPRDQEEGTRLFELPILVQDFLYGTQIFPQGNTTTTNTHSTFDSEIQDFQVATSVQEGQDFQGLVTRSEMFDFAHLSGIFNHSHSEMLRSQTSSPNLQDAPSQVEDIIVYIGCSPMFHILGNERAPILEINSPEINGFPMKVQAFKNTSTEDNTFYLSCTFRNRRTKRIYLTIERLQNLIQNMWQWVEKPYPIVVDESSDILHCMAIEDILWEFTKVVYRFRPNHVKHRFLAGLEQIKFFIILSYGSVSFVLSLIPLLSDKKSLFFLFFLFVLVPYLIALNDKNPLNFYFIKSLLCPICVKIFGFNKLYKSRSSFRWCNEFRKKRIVNPTHFWIDEEYANTFPHAASCLDVCGFVEFSSHPKGQSFTVSCQGWPAGVPSIRKTQHDYKLRVKFDSTKLIKGVWYYTIVNLAFFEDDCFLGNFNYSAIEVQKVHLVEKLFHCFSNPSFGGYVEKICPRGYCSSTFVAHCPRFIEFCQLIFRSNPIPKLLVASRMPGSKIVVGVPFWSSEL